jgi:1-acyl-sn-glycerol-3-phosphate acyltransferase
MMPEPACAREPLVDAISRFLAHRHTSDLSGIRASLERAIDEAGPDGLRSLSQRLSGAGADWDYYPRDPLARRIHHVLAARVLQQAPLVTGTDHLAAVAGKPLVILANHLSYSDANAIEVLLQQAGQAELADRLTVIAGPKVYSNLTRRFSSLCFGTIKIPQSSTRSSGETVMNPREVARASRRSIEVAHERLAAGEALLIFPEGARSRTGEMQPLLAGVARYLDAPDVWVVPMGLTGTEKLFPIGEATLNPVPLTLGIGEPIAANVLRRTASGNRQAMMDAIGVAIANLLPRSYRGAYRRSDFSSEV